ncbi:MAG TPA: hypothetical protein VIW24_26620 [Aldersonia sp.]
MRSWALLGGILLVAVIVSGLLTSPRPETVAGDRLGPEAGESIPAYTARAATTLATTLADGPGDPRWALVSLDTPITVEQALATAYGVRISQILFRAPTPDAMLVVLAVPDNADAVRRASGFAAQTDPAITPDCPCVAALLVRAYLPALREVATRPGVTAVEALLADAVYGRFAVTP